jgi:hypothetical protein
MTVNDMENLEIAYKKYLYCSGKHFPFPAYI